MSSARDILEFTRDLIADRLATATEATRGNADAFLAGRRAGLLDALEVVNRLLEAELRP